MTILSPAAQAVYDAAMNTPEEMPYEHDIAAALRAAADYLRNSYANEEIVDSPDDFLYGIAAELEGDSIEN